MTYVISDLNGDYDKYIKMKDKILLKKRDDLFLLGNIIGYGQGGIDILTDAMEAENIFPMAGVDELNAICCLRALNRIDTSKENMKKIGEWMKTEAGEKTATALSKMDKEDREYLLDYLAEEFTLVEELSVGGRDFILANNGLGNFSKNKSIDDYTPDELTYGDFDIEGDYFDDKIIVCGSTPTHILGGEYDGKIYHGNNVICINTDVIENRPMACIRLDDLKEYYVD